MGRFKVLNNLTENTRGEVPTSALPASLNLFSGGRELNG